MARASEAAEEQIAEIVSTFELLGDWEQRYEYLVELGERLPPMDESDRQEGNRVHECMSLVHIAARPLGDGAGRIGYLGDCDTAIIKGVVALLIELLSERTPREIMDADVDRLFEGLRLDEHLSPSRHVGVYAIVNKMKAQAASHQSFPK